MIRSIKGIFTFISFFIVITNTVIANNDPKEKTLILKGKVLDYRHNETLSGVSIKTTSSEKTLYSDLSGNFFMYIKIKDEKEFKLEFSQVGYHTKTLTVADIEELTCNLEVSLVEE
jgi:hypothetical protein